MDTHSNTPAAADQASNHYESAFAALDEPINRVLNFNRSLMQMIDDAVGGCSTKFGSVEGHMIYEDNASSLLFICGEALDAIKQLDRKWLESHNECCNLDRMQRRSAEPRVYPRLTLETSADATAALRTFLNLHPNSQPWNAHMVQDVLDFLDGSEVA